MIRPARATIDCGSRVPMAPAVLALITNSTDEGSSIGKSAGFAPLDADAVAGTGWVVGGALAAVEADNVQILSADTLLIHFRGAMPADGFLHYGYGYGRLAGDNQPAQGNAIYDLAGLPIWTPATGVKADFSPIA